MRHEIERDLAALAQTQYGLVTRRQAKELGLTDRMVDHRVNIGRLLVIHPCTYAIAGSPDSHERRLMAACLWSRGLASHRAAGRLWQLAGCSDERVEILTSNLQIVPRAGILVHHTDRLPPEQIACVEGIPVTSVERTLLDLGAVVSKKLVAIALDDALHRGLTTLGDLDHCLFRTARRGRRGCAVLREVIRRRERVSTTPHTPLETLVFELLSTSSLPTPEPQFEVRADDGVVIARPDFVYPEFRVAVEAHSRKWHLAEETAFEDASRHNDLTALGFRVLYVTKADVIDRPVATLMRVGRALTEAGWVPGEDQPRIS